MIVKAGAAFDCFLVCTAMLLLIIGMVAADKKFYNAQFEKQNSAEEVGLTKSEINKVRDKIIGYFAGKTDDIQVYVSFNGGEPKPFFSADEISHMHDAKVVFTAVRIAGWVLLGVGLGLVILTFRSFSFGAIVGPICLALLFAVLGLIIAIDFDKAFEAFHGIFFPQGNWQFNTPMVEVLNDEFFMEAAFTILIRAASFAAVMVMCGLAAKILTRRKVNVTLTT